jgi:hypothetical protein
MKSLFISMVDRKMVFCREWLKSVSRAYSFYPGGFFILLLRSAMLYNSMGIMLSS